MPGTFSVDLHDWLFEWEGEDRGASLACFECAAELEVPICWTCGVVYTDPRSAALMNGALYDA
jgi:hypothetical protein